MMAETTLFNSEVLHIERFVLHPDESRFNSQGCVSAPIAVFPKNPIWISHDGQPAFVADTSLVNFYNQNQVYRRAVIDPNGDYCHSFQLRGDLFCELQDSHQPLNSVFDFQHLPCTRSAFVRQHEILRAINTKSADDLEIEEKSINLITDILGTRRRVAKLKRTNRQHQRHQHIVESVKSSLQQQLAARVSLHELAQQNHLSVYHLSRSFKSYSGVGISQYRTQQRLRAATFRILDGEDLTSVALAVGFASHSHLSDQFRKHFGCTPSVFRQLH